MRKNTNSVILALAPAVGNVRDGAKAEGGVWNADKAGKTTKATKNTKRKAGCRNVDTVG
jgi:hypothetical protein